MSSGTLNLLIGLAMGLNLLALGSSRLPSLIRTVSLQGVVLGVMPLLMEHEVDWRVGLVALATVMGKGMLIPGLLRRAMRAANIDREVEPFIGFVPSLLLGAGGTIAAVALARALPLLPEHAGSLLVPGAIASVLTGFILLIGRAKAISQVCGYLILENGIYLFGLLLIHSMPSAGGGGHPPRPHGGGVRHRHHRGSHPARFRFARHPQTHHAPGMKALLLIIVPLVGAALAALWPSNRTRPWLLPAFGLVHVALVFWLFLNPARGCAGRMVGLRSAGAGGVAGGVVVVSRLRRLWGVLPWDEVRAAQPRVCRVAAGGPGLVERRTSGPAFGSAVDMRRRPSR